MCPVLFLVLIIVDSFSICYYHYCLQWLVLVVELLMMVEIVEFAIVVSLVAPLINTI